MRIVEAPKFERRFLHPRYWLLWFGFSLIYVLSWLPYPVVRWLGRGIGKLFALVGKKRVAVAKRNLELCFPNWSDDKRAEVLNENIAASGMAVFETVMGWWWPDWRVKQLTRVEGFEHVEAILAKNKGVFGMAIHCLSLEFACRAIGLQKPSVAFYRKHNNDLMEYLQYHGRARSNKYMIHKRDVKGMFAALSDGEITLYLPDQDYGRNRSVFVPFFEVQEASTTLGTMLFMNNSRCESVFVQSISSDKGYLIKIWPGLEDFPSGDDIGDVIRVNKQMEKMVLEAPEQYLWMHKRFKTRPNESDPSLY